MQKLSSKASCFPSDYFFKQRAIVRSNLKSRKHYIGKIMKSVAVTLLLLALASSSYGLRTLTTENFEHDTQAATGQTTGVW